MRAREKKVEFFFFGFFGFLIFFLQKSDVEFLFFSFFLSFLRCRILPFFFQQQQNKRARARERETEKMEKKETNPRAHCYICFLSLFF